MKEPFEIRTKEFGILRIALFCVSAAALGALAVGCTVQVGPSPPPPPPVAVAPGPVAPAPVVAPEYYVWDGTEFVGWYAGSYVYWSGGVWLPCPEIVIGRFHAWERYHPDWRRGAIRWERGHREPHR